MSVIAEPLPGASVARGYSWPPFEPGHSLSTRHGIWSKRRVDTLAQELVCGLLDDKPELGAYPEAVMAWGRAESRCLMLADWVAEHGLVAEDGTTPAPLKHIAQFERLASDMRAKLGLDPRSDAELKRERAEAIRSTIDLDELRRRGRQVIDANSSEPELT